MKHFKKLKKIEKKFSNNIEKLNFIPTGIKFGKKERFYVDFCGKQIGFVDTTNKKINKWIKGL